MSDGIENITVREAIGADTLTLVRFNECLAQETENIHLARTKVVAGVRAVLADPSKGAYIVAERDGAVAGALLVTYEWSDWRNGCFIWIQSVYVEPAHRRKGVFTRLFRTVAEMAEAPPYCGIRLYAAAENEAARAVYQRLGLRHQGYLVFESTDSLREAH